MSRASFSQSITWRQGILALSPMFVFLAFYLVVSLLIGDFYKMPLVVSLVLASVWAIFIYRGHPLPERIDVFSRASAHADIMYMIWVFVLAGAFARLAGDIGAVDATVSHVLRVFPAGYLMPALFLAACIISFAIGTSVGTVVALAPLAVEMARAGSAPVALFVAVVLGGAFFGDNLSFISDTTIAATRSQGCSMSDKFKANLKIVLPAALLALVVYAFIGKDICYVVSADNANPWLMLPYLVVIVSAVMGVNVMLVLLAGIVAALGVGLGIGLPILDMAGSMGAGIESMGALIIITLLSAGMLGIIKAAGGITWLLQCLTHHVRGKAGAQGCIAALVALTDVCTANNTVAIITVGPVARDIADRFAIDPRRSASLLDTCSCIMQCIIPYGAQTLLAANFAAISPADPIAYQVYPAALIVTVLIAILRK